MTQPTERAGSLDLKRELEDSPGRAASLLEDVHAADAAEWLLDVSGEDAWLAFSALGAEKRAEILEYAEDGLRAAIVPRLSAGDLGEIVRELPPDEAVDLLAEADERVREDVLDALPPEHALELRELIAHPKDSAGGVMTSDFVAVKSGERVGDAIKLIKQEGEQAEEEPGGVFVVDEHQRPIGYVPDRTLLTHSIHSTVDEVMAEPVTVGVDEDQEEAAQLISKYGLSTVAVVDGEGSLVGIISAEDAQGIAEEEVAEDLMRIVGTSPDMQQTRLSIATRVRQRLPLMGVTVLGGLFTARILGAFLPMSGADADASAILRYLPIVIGLAGNVGIQSSTILVRGFATGEVEPGREAAVCTSEVSVGLLIGLVCGAATALFAAWMEGGAAWLGDVPPMLFGAAVGSAISIAVTWASALGCLVPIACRRSGIDPAIVAGPFLICLSDVSGSAIYIVVALRILGQLLPA